MCDLNKKFEAFYQRNKREQDWYKILGVRSFWEIAKDVGRTAEYSVIYSSGSEVMHGSTYTGQVAFDGPKVITDRLRSPEEINYSLKTAMTLTFNMIRSTLVHYRPAELESLNRKYREDWDFPVEEDTQDYDKTIYGHFRQVSSRPVQYDRIG